MILQTTYDKSEMDTRIVHIGFGAFHRGHQAVYNDLMNEKLAQDGKATWGIGEINLFGDSTITDYMIDYSNNFTVVETSAEQTTSRLVRTITEAVHAPKEGIQPAIDMLCQSSVNVVTLTITEKGYCANMQTRKLDMQNELIQYDLNSIDTPKSAIGLLTLAIKRRRELGLKPFTILSCDNISENGVLLADAIMDFSTELDPELAKFIRDEVKFPSSMVDRIVPAITEESLDLIESETGRRDLTGIVCEEFRQWVIEDQFVGEKPDWHLAGATFTNDVAIYEEMKLRMLNGSHTFLSCMSQLMGITYIFETMQHSKLRAVVRKMMIEDQAASLSPKLNENLEKYADLLLHRFSNENVRHMTAQIIQDSSQKIVQRGIEPILELFNRGKIAKYTPAMIAAWMQYVSQNEKFIDPLQEKIKLTLNDAQSAEEKFNKLINLEDIFPKSLIENNELLEVIRNMFMTIEESGAEGLLNTLLETK
ncbi:mannitol dehydrogenase family protein [Vibrio algivorus]|uniref:Fructuronate reductase n=1 Tax=Vibrio algivorus TaxID=1667024 RepID=A0ABQ6EQU0_9VIBR|nr:mannitol dehydrogenase family protein [Vibrio algivorus]GLT15317.1 fructuronate reductase [Vibrio algivorus]